MLEGTGALAGRRDRQTGQAPPGVFNSVRDHSKEEEAAKCVVSKISQTTYLDPIFNQESTADPQKVIQESKASISEARTSVFFFCWSVHWEPPPVVTLSLTPFAAALPHLAAGEIAASQLGLFSFWRSAEQRSLNHPRSFTGVIRRLILALGVI